MMASGGPRRQQAGSSTVTTMGNQTAIRLEVLPARLGDCLLVECLREQGPSWRMLVDGGPPDTWPMLEARLKDDPRIDVAVITHIDSDHIGGMIPYLTSPLASSIGDVWFNGRTHLPDLPQRSVAQGESVVAALRALPSSLAGGPQAFRCRGTSPSAAAPSTLVRKPASSSTPSPAARGSRCCPRRPSDCWHSPRRGTARCRTPSAVRRRPGQPDVLGTADRPRSHRRGEDLQGRLGAERLEHRPAARAPRGERRARCGRLRHGSRRRASRGGRRARCACPQRRRLQAPAPREQGQRARGPGQGRAGPALRGVQQRRHVPPPRRRGGRPGRDARAARGDAVVQLPHAAHRALGRAGPARAARLPDPLPRRRGGRGGPRASGG